ncbi:MAG: hypothetical protein LUH14_13180 [Clostridiaceae bacterium]|nr:hypothetical protein [Clostridiaceae bacterium]
MKIRRSELGTVFAFIVIVLCYIIEQQFMGSDSDLRYIMTAGVIVIEYISLFLRYGFKIFKLSYSKETISVCILSLLLIVLSAVKAASEEKVLTFRTFVSTAYILFPVLYAYAVHNKLRIEIITRLMETCTILIIFFYMIDKGFFNFFDIDSYLTISFSMSYSVFESTKYADWFFSFFVYFLYFERFAKTKAERTRLRFFTALTAVFTFLAFHRLTILMMPVMFIIRYFVDLRGQIPRWIVNLTTILFSVATVVYTKLMQGELWWTYEQAYVFSTGRAWALKLWGQKDYLSYGYGTSLDIIGNVKGVEMELVQMYLEVGILAVVVFLYIFLRAAGKNAYTYALMILFVMNMLMAATLWIMFNWIIIWLTIMTIGSQKLENEGVALYERRQRFKKLFTRKKNRAND